MGSEDKLGEAADQAKKPGLPVTGCARSGHALGGPVLR